MKGFITPVVIWSLALAPAVMAVCRVRRRYFVGLSAAVGLASVCAYALAIGLGYGFTENMTTSLSGHVYMHRRGEMFGRGDLIAFKWRGGATYPRGVIFVKRVIGLPGDEVRVDGRKVWVAGQYVGIAKPVSKAGVPLDPTVSGVIPAGEYFVATPSVDSLDSRYSLTGNIRAVEILGRAHELF